jgi:hypothetical protein
VQRAFLLVVAQVQPLALRVLAIQTLVLACHIDRCNE